MASWVPHVHALIDAGGLDESRGRTVSRDYLHRLVDELAAAADYSTGRNCMPGHEELGATLGRPTKTAVLARLTALTPTARARAEVRLQRDRARQVTNAIAVLIRTGLLVCVEEGRMLTYTEKIELYANGVNRRYARAVYALTLPHPSPLPLATAGGKPVDNPTASKFPPTPIFGPPRSGLASSLSSVSLDVFGSGERRISESPAVWGQHPTTAHRLTAEHNEKDGAARRPAPKRKVFREIDPGLYVFVDALRKALPGQLSGVSPYKLACVTHRFWKAGWDAPTLTADILNVYDTTLHRPYPTYRPGNPAAWLGWVLKHLNPHHTPALRRYDTWSAAADQEPCPHGTPGGTRLSIITSRAKCPLCRCSG